METASGLVSDKHEALSDQQQPVSNSKGASGEYRANSAAAACPAGPEAAHNGDDDDNAAAADQQTAYYVEEPPEQPLCSNGHCPGPQQPQVEVEEREEDMSEDSPYASPIRTDPASAAAAAAAAAVPGSPAAAPSPVVELLPDDADDAVGADAAAADADVAQQQQPHKRHLSAGPEEDPQKDSEHTAKRAAAEEEGRPRSPSCSPSRSPGRGVLASVFAQPHVQAVFPANEMGVSAPESMLPPRPMPLPPQQPSFEAPAQQPSLQLGGGDRRVLHSWSSGSLPAPSLEPIPSSSSLQGWLPAAGTGSPLAGSPLKRQMEGSGSGSFRRWMMRSENSCGSFSLPTGLTSAGNMRQASLELEDSLAMDIKLLPPVVPEEVPPEEEGEEAVAAAEQRQWERQRMWRLEQQRQLQVGVQTATAASIAASERAFHAKIAGWEDELLGMLQAQVRGVDGLKGVAVVTSIWPVQPAAACWLTRDPLHLPAPSNPTRWRPSRFATWCKRSRTASTRSATRRSSRRCATSTLWCARLLSGGSGRMEPHGAGWSRMELHGAIDWPARAAAAATAAAAGSAGCCFGSLVLTRLEPTPLPLPHHWDRSLSSLLLPGSSAWRSRRGCRAMRGSSDRGGRLDTE